MDEKLILSVGPSPTRREADFIPDDVSGSITSDPSRAEQRPVDPFDQEFPGDALVGTFDAWVGQVKEIYDGSADGVLHQTQTIAVRRAGFVYGTNNAPSLYDAPSVHSQAQETWVKALPYPPRHDQVAWIVAVDDVVTCFTGRDGRNYYLRDELSFIGVVLGAGTNSGSGDGLTSVQVRRQAIGGTTAALAFTDLLDSGGTAVDYADVWIVDDNGADQGYETDDRIIVHRRGLFLFAYPVPEVGEDGFWAEITGSGAAGEGGTNSWTYSWKLVEKTVAGYGGWTDVSPAVTGSNDAYNTIEDINTGSGTQGNGVDADNLVVVDEFTFEMQACPTGNIVRMRKVVVPTDPEVTEYWFSHENGVDGVCD